jgi:hypothetical protein
LYPVSGKFANRVPDEIGAESQNDLEEIRLGEKRIDRVIIISAADRHVITGRAA